MSIEWTDATWNPVIGCTRVSRGCDRCYAVRQSFRLEAMDMPRYAGLTVLNRRGERHFAGVVRCLEDRLDEPRRWKRPRRVFVNSMSDLFHPLVPDDFVRRVFDVIAACPRHTFQVLTKRPERAAAMAASLPWPPNLWMGTSAEDRRAMSLRVPHLSACPAALRFLSIEPLLDDGFRFDRDDEADDDDVDVDFLDGIGWVIVGGESGPGARPCDVVVVESIIEQCRRHVPRVAVFVKQLGSAPERSDLAEPGGWDEVPGARVDWELTGRIWLRHPRGGDPSEWPERLRMREFPEPSAPGGPLRQPAPWNGEQ